MKNVIANNPPAELPTAGEVEGKVDPLKTTPEGAAHLRVSKSYLDKLRVYGGGPEFVRFGARKILYRTSALDRWVHERRHQSTSE